jgi:hypothetical protein
MQARAHTCVGCSVACLATSFFFGSWGASKGSFRSHCHCGQPARLPRRPPQPPRPPAHGDPPTQPPAHCQCQSRGSGQRPGIRPLAGSRRGGPTSTPLNLVAQGPCRRSLARRAEIHHGRATPLTLAAARRDVATQAGMPGSEEPESAPCQCQNKRPRELAPRGLPQAQPPHPGPPPTVTRPPTPLANGPGIRPGSHRGPTLTPLNLIAHWRRP